MRGVLAGLAAGLVLGGAGVAIAGSGIISARTGQIVNYGGIGCQATNGGFVCENINGVGYAVGISPQVVAVFRLHDQKLIWHRLNG